MHRFGRDAAAKPENPERPGAAFDGEAAKRPADDALSVPASGAEAAAPSLSLPVKTFKLSNGLTVVVHTDKTSPVVARRNTNAPGLDRFDPG